MDTSWRTWLQLAVKVVQSARKLKSRSARFQPVFLVIHMELFSSTASNIVKQSNSSTLRYWNDVKIGEKLPNFLKDNGRIAIMNQCILYIDWYGILFRYMILLTRVISRTSSLVLVKFTFSVLKLLLKKRFLSHFDGLH